jgi:hypothetical protein
MLSEMGLTPVWYFLSMRLLDDLFSHVLKYEEKCFIAL